MESIIVNIKLPSHRVYELAWAVAKLHGYETLDQYINDVVLEALEAYPDGRDSFELSEVDWGFKTQWQKEKEQRAKISR